MKQWIKIFALTVCILFVLILIQGCGKSTAQKANPIVPTSGKLTQTDVKRARLVSAENLELKSQIDKLNKDIDDLNAKVAKAQQENEKIKKSSQQNMEILFSSMPKMDTKVLEQNKKLKAEVADLKKSNEQLMADFDKSEETKKLKAEIENLKKANEETMELMLSSLSEATDQLKKENQQLKDQLDKSLKEIEKLKK